MKTCSRGPNWLRRQLSVVILATIPAWPSTAQAEETNSEFASHADLDLYRREGERAHRGWWEKYATSGGIHTFVNVWGYRCQIGLASYTNITTYKPLPRQAFDAWLYDPDGKPVRKTRQGRRRFGQPLRVDLELLDPQHHTILNIMRDERSLHPRCGDSCFWDFDVFKCFRIKKPGPHRLEVQVRLFVKDTNGVFHPLFLPRVERVVNVPERDLPTPIPWGDILVYGGGLSLCALGLGWLIWRWTSQSEPGEKTGQ